MSQSSGSQLPLSRLKIALAQANPTLGDIDANLEKLVAMRARAAKLGADLLAGNAALGFRQMTDYGFNLGGWLVLALGYGLAFLWERLWTRPTTPGSDANLVVHAR